MLPVLRKSIKRTKARKAKRLTNCKREAEKARARYRASALRARNGLTTRLAALRDKLKAASNKCRGRARADALAELDRALAAIDQEREAIAALRRKAAQLRDSSKRAGGLRAAELRAESDEEVQRELPDDPAWHEAWRSVRSKIQATPHRSRTEAFFEYVHDHPTVIDQARAKLEHRYELEADALFESLWDCQKNPDTCPEHWGRQLDKAENLLKSDPDPVPF